MHHKFPCHVQVKNGHEGDQVEDENKLGMICQTEGRN